MNYRSTAGEIGARTFEQVLIEGAAPDGGLYVPDSIPSYRWPGEGSPHSEYVAASLEQFGGEDMGELAAEACRRFNHPEVAPLSEVGDFQILELWWGPTLSFKDHALQVLGRLFDRYLTERGERRTVLVATSGDTGSAAIEGFRGLDAVEVVVLYPVGKVSDFQRRQMTTVDDPNVVVLAVEGTFDDCQRLIKQAFRTVGGLASANSINWGRIAAQVGYHMATAARIGEPYEVVVPTGNFGNAFSAWVAREMGAPIRRITVATNANRALYELHTTGRAGSGDVAPTLAPAMDIQVPSNLERFADLRSEAAFAEEFDAGWADDDVILEVIRRVAADHGKLIDPHTAVAWSVAESQGPVTLPRVVVSTAHPAKFADTMEKAAGVIPEVPAWAAIDPALEERDVEIEPTLEALGEYLH